MDRFVVSMKYGTAYPSAYVNVLYRAVRRAMRGPFRFVCLTDDPRALLPDIESYPIPDIGLLPHEWFIGGVWPKISLFDSAMNGLRGRALFIDLDMVILRDIDDFFDIDSPFVGLNAGPGWGREGFKPEFGSAIFSFDLGSMGYISDYFRNHKSKIINSFRTEQAFAASMIPQIDYWPRGWVLSFKRSLRQPLFIDLFKSPKTPPSTAKVIAFHGKPRPRDLIGEGPRFWDRFPHMGHGVVGWMMDYWVDNGGVMSDDDKRQ